MFGLLLYSVPQSRLCCRTAVGSMIHWLQHAIFRDTRQVFLPCMLSCNVKVGTEIDTLEKEIRRASQPPQTAQVQTVEKHQKGSCVRVGTLPADISLRMPAWSLSSRVGPITLPCSAHCSSFSSKLQIISCRC